MAAFIKFNSFVKDLGDGVHKLGTDTLSVYLTNIVPDSALDLLKADLAEITNQNGYTAPVALTTVTWASNGAIAELKADDLTAIAAGAMVTATGAVGPFQHVILYNSSTAVLVNPLIGAWSYASAITLASGETFEVDFGTTVLTNT